VTGQRQFWAIAALLVLVAFAFQGTRALFEPDEGRYTATALNMLDSGDWLVPSVDGERPHLTKPPVTYWAIAASVGLLGYHEWAVRLPGALAFVGTGLLVFGLGRRFCPAKPWLPALVWGLSLAPVIGANIVSTDALLTLFETAAMYAFVEAWYRDGPDRRRWLLAMWLGWGLAFMTKGPPGLLPLGAMVAFLAVHDRPKLRGLFAPAGLLLFALVGFTWFAILIRQEPARLGYFLGYEVYDRVFTATHARNSEWYGGFAVYLPVLLAGALPWWLLALFAAGGPRGAWQSIRAHVRARDRESLLLLYWLTLPILVFLLARSRLELYLLPLFVPLALVLARALGSWVWLDDRRLRRLATAMALGIVVLKGVSGYWPTDRDARQMAVAIREAVDLGDVDEIAFIDMRGFFGLTLYLDVGVESVRIGGEERPHSRRVPTVQELCSELAEGERSLYAIKRQRVTDFPDAVAACGPLVAREVGSFHGDGNEIVLFTVRPIERAAPDLEVTQR
jgi:4-amino-4-deoxy-L-arabinose transferase-like glycosyltransferase